MTFLSSTTIGNSVNRIALDKPELFGRRIIPVSDDIHDDDYMPDTGSVIGKLFGVLVILFIIYWFIINKY